MLTRNADGPYRGGGKQKAVSAAIARARWIEKEIYQYRWKYLRAALSQDRRMDTRTLGVSYKEIARHLVAVVHGVELALVPIPPDVVFFPDFRISQMAVWKAWKRSSVLLDRIYNRGQNLPSRTYFIENETAELRRLGYSFRKIAQLLSDLAAGIREPISPMPADLKLPPDFTISAAAVAKAWKRIATRDPVAGASPQRLQDLQRIEQRYGKLQERIQRGDLDAIREAIILNQWVSELRGLGQPSKDATKSNQPQKSSVGLLAESKPRRSRRPRLKKDDVIFQALLVSPL